MANRFKDETGKRYGRLTVIKHLPLTKKQRGCCFLCRCDCGNMKVAMGRSLRFGDIKSCGCLSREWAKNLNLFLPEGISGFNVFLSKLKRKCKLRAREFSITDTEAFKFTQQPCFYCGVPPRQRTGTSRQQEFVYNGMDRVDNKRGYALDNIVPCCGKCNSMKRTLSIEEFETHIRNMYKTLLKRKGEMSGLSKVCRDKNGTNGVFRRTTLPGVQRDR